MTGMHSSTKVRDNNGKTLQYERENCKKKAGLFPDIIRN